MAYATSLPPTLTLAGPLTGAGQIWTYRSTDLGSVVDGANYFTNGKDLGMRAGDVVLVQGTTAFLMTSHSIISISSTGGADLSDGTTLASTTNSD